MAQTMNPERPAQEMTWDQRLLRNSGRQKAALKPEYQELKFTLHRKLLDKINLEALATIDNQRVRAEVRQAVISLIDGEPTLLSSLEKQQISEEVLDEVFGLGPLEPLLGRIDPYGGRPVERRKPRQRYHSSARGGRSAALHPPFRNRQANAAGL